MFHFNFFHKRQHHAGSAPEKGQGLVEYALILALVALAVVVIIEVLEPAVANVFSQFVQQAPVAPPQLLSYTPPPTNQPPPSPTPTLDPSITPSITPTFTPTPIPSNTPTPTTTPSPTNTPTPTITPTPAPNILFVAGAPLAGMAPSDVSIRNALAALNPVYPNNNNMIKVVDDDVVQTADANNKILVVISPLVSSNSGVVGSKFRDVPIPVVVMEDGLFDDMGMTTGGNTQGTENNQTQINIINSGHYMSAGLSGLQTVYITSDKMNWGTPGTAAVKIATITGNNNGNKYVIFGYDKQAAMPALPNSAPARRVGFYLYENVHVQNGQTPQGFALFNVAIGWALGN